MNNEHKISLTKFAVKLMHTENYVWVGPLKVEHGDRKYTEKEWWDVIENMKSRKA